MSSSMPAEKVPAGGSGGRACGQACERLFSVITRRLLNNHSMVNHSRVFKMSGRPARCFEA